MGGAIAMSFGNKIFAGRQAGRRAGGQAGMQASRLACRQAGWHAGWLAGWQAGRQNLDMIGKFLSSHWNFHFHNDTQYAD